MAASQVGVCHVPDSAIAWRAAVRWALVCCDTSQGANPLPLAACSTATLPGPAPGLAVSSRSPSVAADSTHPSDEPDPPHATARECRRLWSGMYGTMPAKASSCDVVGLEPPPTGATTRPDRSSREKLKRRVTHAHPNKTAVDSRACVHHTLRPCCVILRWEAMPKHGERTPPPQGPASKSPY